MKTIDTPREFITGDENCFNIAYAVASSNPELVLQAGVFLMFDHKNKYWDSIYTNHYWCITPERKIVDQTRHLWPKFAAKLDFEYKFPEHPKVLMLGDAYVQVKLIDILQSDDEHVVSITRTPRFFGEADVVYMPGIFFAPKFIPEWIKEQMKVKGFFTIADVISHDGQNKNQ